jgi:DNA polymerase-4
MPRKIIHLDLDAFFCAVEELRDPDLVGRPFAVGGKPDERGVVASCSYAARRFGVRSAMPMSRALRLCPQLKIISSRHGEYGRISTQVMERLARLTPLVEQISIDEAFLDISDMPDDPAETARRLQALIRSELGLPSSLGVAGNKLVAKIATDFGKAANRSDAPPNAITVVPPGEEAGFLAPLPVDRLWGVGPKTAARLEELGVLTIGDLARFPEAELKRIFGKNGSDLSLHARGIDDRPVITTHEVKSISQETTFSKDVHSEDILLHTLASLSERVARRLRQDRLACSTVKIKVRWQDFTTLTRQTTLTQPSDQDSQITAAAEMLFSKVWVKGKPVRLLGVGAGGLCPAARQLSLWDHDIERERRLHEAIDSIQAKYGNNLLHRGYRGKISPQKHPTNGEKP